MRLYPGPWSGSNLDVYRLYTQRMTESMRVLAESTKRGALPSRPPPVIAYFGQSLPCATLIDHVACDMYPHLLLSHVVDMVDTKLFGRGPKRIAAAKLV